MWHSATHGLANISGNMIRVSYRPSPVPISVSGNITNGFIRSRTKPAFSIRHSQCFKGLQRNCQEDWDSRGRSVSIGRVIPFGVSVPVCTGGLSFAFLWAQGLRQTHSIRAEICPFCLQPLWATFAHSPALAVEPEDGVGAAIPWDVPSDW